jgi:hypothetical protein
VTWALAHLASLYEDCYINLEVKGPGNAIMSEMRRMKQIYQSQLMSEVVNKKQWGNVIDGAKWYLWHRPDSLGKGYAYGINTTFDVKIAIMNEFRDSYINGLVDLRSLRCLKQMQYIVQEGSEIGPGAKGRNHDDFVFSLAFAHRAWQDWVRPTLIEEGYSLGFATADDMVRKSGARPSPVASVVAHFFADKEKARQEGPAIDVWFRERGLR